MAVQQRQWQYSTLKSCPHLTRAEHCLQEAEMWCVDDCNRCRFWKLNEVMWLCPKCRVWYHMDCCNTKKSERVYTTLGDILSAPLLRGGSFSTDGTAPCIFSASELVKKIETEEGKQGGGALNTPVTHEAFEEVYRIWLGHQRRLEKEIECPRCGFWSHHSLVS